MSAGHGALLLAGGRSERMGRDKALLEIAGEPLWKRQVERLVAAGAAEVVVSCRREQGLHVEGGQGAVTPRFVFDPPSGAEEGMLGALARCLNEMPPGPVLVLAVDLPFVTADFLGELWERSLAAKRGVLLRTDRWEPLLGVYTSAMRPLLREAALAERGRSLQKLCGAWVQAGLAVEWALATADHRHVRNCNTPDEWAAAFAAE